MKDWGASDSDNNNLESSRLGCQHCNTTVDASFYDAASLDLARLDIILALLLLIMLAGSTETPQTTRYSTSQATRDKCSYASWRG